MPSIIPFMRRSSRSRANREQPELDVRAAGVEHEDRFGLGRDRPSRCDHVAALTT